MSETCQVCRRQCQSSIELDFSKIDVIIMSDSGKSNVKLRFFKICEGVLMSYNFLTRYISLSDSIVL